MSARRKGSVTSVTSGIDSDDEFVATLEEDDVLAHIELSLHSESADEDSAGGAKWAKAGLPVYTADHTDSHEQSQSTLRPEKRPSSLVIPNLKAYDETPRNKTESFGRRPLSPTRIRLEQERRLRQGENNLNEKVSGPGKQGLYKKFKDFWFPDELPKTWIYQATWIVDAIVMSILKYVFCVVGAVIIHDSHYKFKNSLAIGIGVQCASTFVTCLYTSAYSKLGINISGPDIIAAIFAGLWASSLTNPQSQITVTDEQALPTLLFLIAVSTLLMGILWLAIGYTGASRIVDFMPQPVVSGFLACIGWKVLKYAGKVSTGPAWYTWNVAGFSWPFFMLLIPAIPLGIPLYLLKRFHIGKPLVILPFFLVVPTVVFFIAFSLQSENSMDKLRKIHWMFPDYPTASFWQIWTELKWEHIAWQCIPRCLPDMAIMTLILILDSFLKLSSTKGALKVNIDMMHEMKVTGWENVLSALFVSAPGYPQVKFNILSNGIINNTVDRKVGVAVGLFCGIMWLSGFMFVKYLPRFLLGGLLLYAACPFLVDNLYTSYFHMSRMEYGAIWGIFCTVVLGDLGGLSFSLLLAVVVGLVFSTIIFMLQYAQVSVIRNTYFGHDYQSKVVRTYWEEAFISRVGSRAGYIQLEGFIFFASAAQLMDAVKFIIDKQCAHEAFNRMRHLVIDFEYVTNIDYSGVVRLLELRRIVKSEGIALYISGLREGGIIENSLAVEGVFDVDDDGYVPTVCEDMDRAAEIIENHILDRAAKLRSNWLIFNSFKKLHTEAQLRQKFELLEVALGSSANVGHDLWKYGRPIEMKKGELILKEGEHEQNVYLLQRGKVTSFTILDDEDNTVKRLRTCAHGAVINDECIFHDLPCAHSTVAEEDCLLWKLPVSRLQRMETAQPNLAVSIHRHILCHAAVCRHRLEREVNSLEHPGESASARGQRRGRRNLKKGRATKQKKDSRGNRFVEHSLGDSVLSKIRQAHHVAHEDHTTGNSQIGKSIHDHEDNKMEAHTLVEIEAMQHHHEHHYHHLHLDRHMESKMTAKEIAKWSAIQPHMSIVQKRSARKWFLFHAKEHALAERENEPPRYSDISDDQNSDGSIISLAESPNSQGVGSPGSFETSDNEVLQTRILLNIEEVQKCLMDLGLFPSTEEVKLMHQTLGPDRIDSHGRVQFDGNIDESEFLKMVEVMTLAEVSPAQVKTLYDIFVEYAIEIEVDNVSSPAQNQKLRSSEISDAGALSENVKANEINASKKNVDMSESDEQKAAGIRGESLTQSVDVTVSSKDSEILETKKVKKKIKVLTESGLGSLLESLDHPDDEVELHCIMKEWDVKQVDYLDFEALLSIVATYMKIEQLDQQVEEDYLRICGYSVEMQRKMSTDMKNKAEITPELLFNAVMKYGPRRVLLHFSMDDAKEMVYDADLQHEDNKISLDELVTCLEMVGDTEALAEGDEKKAMWRAPSGRHLLKPESLESSQAAKHRSSKSNASGAPAGQHQKKTRRSEISYMDTTKSMPPLDL